MRDTAAGMGALVRKVLSGSGRTFAADVQKCSCALRRGRLRVQADMPVPRRQGFGGVSRTTDVARNTPGGVCDSAARRIRRVPEQLPALFRLLQPRLEQPGPSVG